ncbi:N-acetylneuraminate synthase family protein [Pseudoalteromonas sp. S4741]|uniref:N-acetylneuraminate synthase family protein n=1 Tax=Pseudoalteromonas sp. S4741 TaxID=579563 RepID=UPI00110BB26B|nr:N-acetylneuraminate synthase family protein [Pseudoalteromonas sp. S4741]TMO23968.1 polyhydroxyalkanoate biosynthesis repressor PhaR [Pseudoalteromonas sp. S4741]
MLNPVFELLNIKTGLDYDPLIIAEIGINHGGSLREAFKIVDSAIRAGAKVIKHQTHIVDDEMSIEAKSVIPGNADISIYDIMSRCALSEKDEIALKNYVEENGAIFLSTPFSRAAALRLERMNVCAYKVGSGECNNYPLLELIASFGKPVIISTGMNDIASIKKAVSIFKSYKTPFSLLHTTNLYPTPDNLIRLGAMQQLQEAFPDVVIGLSDHSIDNLACLGAVAAGASILERHYTDTKFREGPDICCSMDEKECKDLIGQSKRMAMMRGGQKKASLEEQVTIDFAYASVVTVAPIKKGEKLTANNLWVKRPGTGDFLASDYANLLGKEVNQDVDANIQLKREYLE